MKRQAGFTLVELLVTMTIVGITIGLLSSSLRFSLSTSERLELRLKRAESIQMAHRVVRGQLQRAMPIPVREGDQIVDVEFSGSAAEVRFVTALQGTGTAGGFYRATLRLERDADSADEERYRLVATYARRDQAEDGDSGAFSRVLIENLTNAGFSYLGRGNAMAAGWQETWSGRGELPALVRLQMANDDSGTFNLPGLVAAPQLSIASWKEINR